MNPEECPSETPLTCFADDALFELELRVASRADELSFQAGGGRERDLEVWLQAEREVLADTCMCGFP